MNGKAKVFRFDPLIDAEPYYKEYSFGFAPGLTVLDVLNQIYEQQDATLAYTYCCRNGHCGICGVTVNHKPVLMCKQAAAAEMIIEPLQNISVKKDLIIDREEYEIKRPKLRLFLERQCHAGQEPERIDMNAFDNFKIASRCVECFCCLAVCPIYKNHPHSFTGPAAFALEARHVFDPRDELNRGLLLKSEGIGLCTECGLCSGVCPHKVDPCGLIKKIKKLSKDKSGY